MITWDETLETGVSNIDAQHKELIQKFNEFSEISSDSRRRQAAGEVLDFLQFYAAWHFEREEKLMEQCNCPAAKENKEAHAEFIAKFGQFYDQWQESTMSCELMRATLSELAKWIENHIRGVDTQLRSHVKGVEENS